MSHYQVGSSSLPHTHLLWSPTRRTTRTEPRHWILLSRNSSSLPRLKTLSPPCTRLHSLAPFFLAAWKVAIVFTWNIIHLIFLQEATVLQASLQEVMDAATSAQPCWRGSTWSRRGVTGSTWERAWAGPGHTLTMSREEITCLWIEQVNKKGGVKRWFWQYDDVVENRDGTTRQISVHCSPPVTAMPGEQHHAPHAPLRQRLSVGGGPAQVRVCSIVTIWSSSSKFFRYNMRLMKLWWVERSEGEGLTRLPQLSGGEGMQNYARIQSLATVHRLLDGYLFIQEWNAETSGNSSA